MAKPVHHSETRQQLLRAALRHFANSGYAATSVQHIVDDARLSKPALYYHFKDKAGLFQALVHEAHDERYRLLAQSCRSPLASPKSPPHHGTPITPEARISKACTKSEELFAS